MAGPPRCSANSSSISPATGSSRLAAQALGKDRFGIEKVYKTEGADSFRAAWERAIEIFEERAAERLEDGARGRSPESSRRASTGAGPPRPGPLAEGERGIGTTTSPGSPKTKSGTLIERIAPSS